MATSRAIRLLLLCATLVAMGVVPALVLAQTPTRASDEHAKKGDVKAPPLRIRGLWIVQDTGRDANGAVIWSQATAPAAIPFSQIVHLRAVIKVSPKIKVSDEIGEQEYFWGFPQGTTDIDSASRTVYQWNNSLARVTIDWTVIVPHQQHQKGNVNDPWNMDYPYFTNVVSSTNGNVYTLNGHTYANPGETSQLDVFLAQDPSVRRGLNSRLKEGDGVDIIEFNWGFWSSGWEVPANPLPGVCRYRIANCFLNSDSEGSRSTIGEGDLASISNLYWQGPKQSYTHGVIDGGVMRIARRSDNPNFYISYIESYTYCSWIYGSFDAQVDNYIGFDCAHLVVGAARKAVLPPPQTGHLTETGYTNASGLATDNSRTEDRGNLTYLYYITDDQTEVRRATDNQPVTITIGTGPNDIHVGDLILFDWNGDGGGSQFDHATVLYGGSGSLLNGQLIFGYRGVDYAGMIEEMVQHGTPLSAHRFRIRKWINYAQ